MNDAQTQANWTSEVVRLRAQIESLTREKAEEKQRADDNYFAFTTLMAERDTLRAELDAATKVMMKIAAHDCGCSPCYGTCMKGFAAEIELQARMEQAQEYLDTARTRPNTAAEETR